MFWLDGVKEVLEGEEAECVDSVFVAVVGDFPGLKGEAYECHLIEREIAAKGVIYRLEGCEPRGSSLDVLVRPRELWDRAEMELGSGVRGREDMRLLRGGLGWLIVWRILLWLGATLGDAVCGVELCVGDEW